MNAPHCRLCGKDHWAREGCQFAAIIKGAKHTIHVDGVKVPKGSILLVSKTIPVASPKRSPAKKKAKRK